MIAAVLRRCAPVLFIVFAPSASAAAATAFVQAATVSQFASAPTTAVTFSSEVTPGNLIALYVAWTNTADTLISVTDNLGNVYALVQNPVTYQTIARAAGAYAKNVAGGPCTVTATFSGANFAARTIIVHEVSGADPFSPLDASAALAQTDPGLRADAVTAGPVATTANGDYIFAATSDQGHASTLQTGSGLTLRQASRSPVGSASEDAIQAAAGPIAATFTNADAPFADYITLVMAFRPVASPDTTPPAVSLSSPIDGAATSGTVVLSASAFDDVRVASVQFKVDGANLGPESPSWPYATAWNTALSTNGPHTLTATARDLSGNTTTSLPVSVTVMNVGATQTIIPSARRVEWSEAGVAGGIVNRTNVCMALGAGATSADINNAIRSCSGGVVLLGAGTYTLSAGITFRGAHDVTLRGAGPDQTTLVFGAPDACSGLQADVCIEGTSPIWSGNVPPANVRDWIGGYAAGTTELTLSSTAGIGVDTILVLDQLDDTGDIGGVLVSDALEFSLEGGSPGRSNRSQQQFVRVVAIHGRQVAITPALHMPNWRASQQPQVWWRGDAATTNGIEDLTLDHGASSAASGLAFHNAYGGWVKNVRSLNANRNHVWLHESARIEVRDSYFYGTKYDGARSYGVEAFTTSDDLVVNNIIEHVTTPLMTGPSAGSVFAYNYIIDVTYYVPTWMMAGIVASHDAGTGMNLFEGNSANQVLMDLYHGTGNLATIFRNELRGTEPNKAQGNTIAVSIWGYNRLVNIVGNVLGTPNYHFVYEDSASGTPGAPERSIYVLGYPGVLESSPSGLPYDAGVAGTLLRWGNYDYATGRSHWDAAEIPSGAPVPPDLTLPGSFFLSAKPAWWGPTPWPAIGPDVTGAPGGSGHVYPIPARACYEQTAKDAKGILLFNATNCYATR